jgi:hypothetical protein
MDPNSSATHPPCPGAVADAPSEQQMHLAYERVVQQLPAPPFDRPLPLNVNVGTWLLTMLGAVPRILPHRPTLARLPTFDVTQLDQLQLHALALAHAQGLRNAAAEATNDVTELARRQRETRERLLVDAAALAQRGHLEPARVDKLAEGVSYLAIAFDVVGLVELLFEHWSAIAGKTAVTRQELELARRGANQLVAALGRRQQTDPGDDPQDRIYREIFSRVTRAYSDVRQALQFIRRKEGDADRMAPSAYRGRPKSARKAADGEKIAAPNFSRNRP